MNIVEKEQYSKDLIENILLHAFDDESDIINHLYPKEENVRKIQDYNYPEFDKAVKMLQEKMDNNRKILIVVDQDADGFTSASLMYRFLKDDLKYKHVHYYVAEGKQHGFSEDIIEYIVDNNFELVIMPDAGSNDCKYHDFLSEKNISLIILDHHLVNDWNISKLWETNKHDDNVVVINNQILERLNTELTGVGMTYIFVKYFNNYNNINVNVEKYLDLVALGQTADVSDISQSEIRYFVVNGLKNIQNSFIDTVLKERGYDNPSSRDLSFSIISMINSITRVGTIEEKRQLFDAMVNIEKNTIQKEVRKKNKKTGKFDKILQDFTIEEYAHKIGTNIKTRQDNMVRKAMKEIEVLNENNVYIGILDDEYNSSITGLVAMKLMSKLGIPVMIGKRYDGRISGSSRAPENWLFKDYLSKSELFTFVNGHQNAHGWSLKTEKLEKLFDYVNKKTVQQNKDIIVDKKFSKPTPEPIFEVYKNLNVFGGSVKYPLFGYENIKIHKSCIRKRGSVTTFFDNEVELVYYNTPESLQEELSDIDSYITLNVVGEPSVNSYKGKVNAQVVIKDCQIVDGDNNLITIIEDDYNEFGIDF